MASTSAPNAPAYSVSTLPVDKLAPGQSVLVTGQPGQGQEQVVYQLAERTTGADPVIVTSRDRSKQAIEKYRRYTSGEAPHAVIDCTDGDPDQEHKRISHISSPGCLTEIGVQVSRTLDDIESDSGTPLVLVNSLCPFLMYSDEETVFKFLHTAIKCLEEHGAVGIFAIDPSAHTNQQVETIKRLFDGLIAIRPDDEDGLTVSTRGI